MPGGKNLIRRKLEEAGLKCFEYNLSSIFQYLRDKEITPMTLIKAEGDYQKERSRVPVFFAEKMEQESSEVINNLRVLSFDIETYAKERAIIPEKNPVLMISFYGITRTGKGSEVDKNQELEEENSIEAISKRMISCENRV